MNLERALAHRLRPLIDAQKTVWRRQALAVAFLVVTGLALGCLALIHWAGWWRTWEPLALASAALLAFLIARGKTAQRRPDLKRLASGVEIVHPNLGAALFTAVEATEKAQSDAPLTYFQERVVAEAVEHAATHDWVGPVFRHRLRAAGLIQAFSALACLGSLVCLILLPKPDQSHPAAGLTGTTAAETPDAIPPPYEITVDPGNAEVERGGRLVVQAAFAGRIPPSATLVLSDPGQPGKERARIPLKAGVDANVFGGLVTAIDRDADYRIEFDSEQSDAYRITTFVHPALETANATIRPPEYTGKPVKELKDTFKVTLMEGSQLAWSLKVNKAISAAELYADDEHIVPLTPSAGDPTVLEASYLPDASRKYRLHLVDAQDRANKEPEWFTVTVNANTPPQLEFVFPKRDVTVSAVQELPMEARVWDDVGILKAGATLNVNGEEKEIILADASLPGDKKHDLTTLLALETLGVKPRDVITYHLWADDRAGDGTVRRSTSDMFFAEVRPFEDIYREQESPGGKGEPGEQNQSAKLLKLQKEILNATWKLVRSADMGQKMDALGSDTGVVRESQTIAIGQTDETLEKVQDAEMRSLFTEAKGQMEQAVEQLQKAVDFSQEGQLTIAMDSERQAYASLVKAQAREKVVTRSSSKSSSSGQGQEQERQLMQLEMKQKDQRYEEETEAEENEANMTPEQKENLAVLARLTELARRQEALEKKIKELENAIEEAKTEEEKKELDRQLKRLQEEQEQLLREVDDLRERMDTPENRPNMAEERDKLDDIRENVREAAENLKAEKLADAGNAAARAQKELEQTQEEFRKKTSRQFTEEMRQVRDQARDLAEKQEALGQKLEERNQAAAAGAERPTPLEQMQLGNQMQEQADQLNQLLEKLRQTSEAAETSEPLLSSALYDAVRNARTGDVEKHLEETRDLTRYGRTDLAVENERAAARGLEQLKNDVEKAAERILGSEADALRLARNELDNLIERSQEEADRLDGKVPETAEDKGASRDGNSPDQGKEKTGQNLGSGDPKQTAATGPPGDKKNPRAGTEPADGKRPPGPGTGQPDPSGKPQGTGQAGKPGEVAQNKTGDPDQTKSPDGSQPGPGKTPGKETAGTGQSEKPDGQNKGPESQQAQNSGKGQGKGEGPNGEGTGQDPQQANAQGEGKGEGAGEGKEGAKGQPGQGRGSAQEAKSLAGGQPGESTEGTPTGAQNGSGKKGAPGTTGARNGSNLGGPNNGGGDDRRQGPLTAGAPGNGKPLFFAGTENTEPNANARDPITGEGYEPFNDGLRKLETMLNRDDLKNEAARISDNARAMRIDHHKDNLPPQAETIRTRIVNPLMELRDAVAEELARKDQKNPLSPVDRDPVPKEYRDLVRRYYEKLGEGN
ncbi:MAG: hypothetical protein R3F31_06000 [Verrucomicrobiales bacterium]